ncbi:ATP-binding protein [Paenibacillus xylanexedens]|uniref:ATP-binding protein n=1 Tax=Paenibacillus xylanexedens TaxID=528191 RepID=UPI003D334931
MHTFNGFDAKATIIELQTFQTKLGSINEIQIMDNGYGIKIQDLEGKFTPFFESDKSIDPNLRSVPDTIVKISSDPAAFLNDSITQGLLCR